MRHEPALWLALGAAFALGLLGFALGQAQPSCAPVAGLDSQESEYLCLLNQYRVDHGLGPVAPSPGLQCAAEWMSNDLATHGYFSHTSSDGRLPWQRAQGCGYSGGVGEILAGGFSSAADVIAAWKSSPGHNAVMLGPNYVAVGISRQTGHPQYGTVWVADFGTVSDGPVVATPTPTRTPTMPPALPRRAILPGVAKD